MRWFPCENVNVVHRNGIIEFDFIPMLNHIKFDIKSIFSLYSPSNIAYSNITQSRLLFFHKFYFAFILSSSSAPRLSTWLLMRWWLIVVLPRSFVIVHSFASKSTRLLLIYVSLAGRQRGRENGKRKGKKHCLFGEFFWWGEIPKYDMNMNLPFGLPLFALAHCGKR